MQKLSDLQLPGRSQVIDEGFTFCDQIVLVKEGISS